MDDASFDRVYPAWVRRISSRFWTPVEVARRAASLLVAAPETRVLDVGAGVGKFLAIGALATGASFTGIEQREKLVAIGRRALAALQVPNATLEHGTLESVDLTAFDAFYFFNPFEENLFTASEHIDASAPLSVERFCADIAIAERAMSKAKVGTRVVTYHGFGGRIPASYQLVSVEGCGSGYLRLWVKAREEKEGDAERGGQLELLVR